MEHPHSSHDRTQEWRSCCMDIFMGRPIQPWTQRKQLNVREALEDDEEDNDSLFGCWSSPECVAIDMIHEGEDREHDEADASADVDSWMTAALALSASVDEVSLMIQRKAASYVSCTDALSLCFGHGNGVGAEHAMTDADRSMLETTVASFAAGMAKQIDSLRQTVAMERGRSHLDHADARQARASGPVGHRVGIAASLMQRLKSEIVDPMTTLQSQRKKYASKNADEAPGGDAAAIARNPRRLFCLRADAPPPAPWEVDAHDAARDRAEQDEEKRDFLSVYFDEGEASPNAVEEEIRRNLLPPPSVVQCMDLPEPLTIDRQPPQWHQPGQTTLPTHQQTTQNMHTLDQGEEEEHIDRLQQESAMLLATYQHSDLEGVRKVEKTMVDITQLLSRFTDLITEQQGEVFAIHEQAVKSKENVDKGQDQLVEAADRGEKSKHPMASFIMAMALLLLFFNWIIP